MIRLILGLLLTPLILQLPYLIPPYGTYSFWWFRLMLVIGYTSMLLFGVPLVWLFIRKRWLAWWQSVLGGIVAVSLFLVLWFVTSSWEHFLQNGIPLTLYSWLLAALSGFVFWCIALWRNPYFNSPNFAFKGDALKRAP
jgi:peptidoglycan/LPS O-acetylase OafA/YrhL